MSDGSWEPYEDEDPYGFEDDELEEEEEPEDETEDDPNDLELCPKCRSLLVTRWNGTQCSKCNYWECY